MPKGKMSLPFNREINEGYESDSIENPRYLGIDIDGTYYILDMIGDDLERLELSTASLDSVREHSTGKVYRAAIFNEKNALVDRVLDDNVTRRVALEFWERYCGEDV